MSIGPSFMLNSLHTQLTQLPGQTMTAKGTQLPNQHLQIFEPLKFSATQWNRWKDGIPCHPFTFSDWPWWIPPSRPQTQHWSNSFVGATWRDRAPKAWPFLRFVSRLDCFCWGSIWGESGFNMRFLFNKTWSSVKSPVDKNPVDKNPVTFFWPHLLTTSN